MAIFEAAIETAHTQARSFTVDISQTWDGTEWTGGRATPFQRREWLDAFYGAAKLDESISPLVATIRDAQGELAMRLPLLIRRKDNLTVIEFADLGLTDFNAPLLGPAAPQTQKESRIALRALRRALPKADLLRLEKMPPVLHGKVNPLSTLNGTRPSAVNGNVIALTDDWEAYSKTRHRTYRMELGRCWRIFQKNPDAQFKIVRDREEALLLLEKMEVQQRERMREVGADYMLDDPIPAEFYRRLVSNAENGFAIVTALTAGDEVVAASLGVRDQDTMITIRLTNAGKKWSNISPGRLAVEKTLQLMHSEGCRTIDLSIGNYAYKRRFGVTKTPLLDYSLALSWRGIPKMLRTRLAGTTRQYPQVHTFIRKALGKSVSREEA
jgi:CelD/BcsL family acetyltransferase involved in cellulose biosynthesis